VVLDLMNTLVQGNIDIITSTGSSFVELYDSQIEGDINIDLNTGSVDLKVSNTGIGADIDILTETGSIRLEVDNLTITEACLISMSTATGSQQIDWMQPHALGGNLTLDLSSDTGSIEIGYQTVLSESRYHVDLSADTGSVDLSSSMDFSVQEFGNREVYTSINYGNLDLPFIDITGSADTGSIDVEIYDY
jgi:hypothetical protein